MLRRLFCQAKVDLRQWTTLCEQEESSLSVIERWEAEEIGNTDDSASTHYQLAVQNKREAQSQLTQSFTDRNRIDLSLKQCRQDIEQIIYELEQIFNGSFNSQNESIQEFSYLFDDLRFDPNINTVQHDFLNDLYVFICLHLPVIK